eukprot:15198887-Alexandrium_andersonii.AAC.1
MINDASSVPYHVACQDRVLDWIDVSIVLGSDPIVPPRVIPHFKPLETPPPWDCSLCMLRASVPSRCFRLHQLRPSLPVIVEQVS